MDSKECVFCGISKNLPPEVILESEHCFSIYDINPITKGHALVITKKHYQDYSSTEDFALSDASILAKKVSMVLMKKYSDIKGFRFISNQGKEGKQVVFHLHIHVIPMY